MDEIWKPVEGYEGLYEVSNLGRVKSLPRRAGLLSIKGRILKQCTIGNGYLGVSLSKEGSMRQMGVHRLVAIAFVPNPENKSTVNHKNEDKRDNRADNLEWLSLRENLQYGTRAQRARQTLSEKIGVPVMQIASDGFTVLKEYASLSLAAEAMRVQPNAIWRCTISSRKCRGYYWKRRDSVTDTDLLFWADTAERVSDPKKPENDFLAKKSSSF